MRTLALVLAVAAACAHRGGPPPRPEAELPAATPAIARVAWSRVPRDAADAYAAYLAEEVEQLHTFPGNLGWEVWRDDAGAAPRVRFAVVSWWSSEATLRAHAGDDLARPRPLPRDAEFGAEPEPQVQHHRVLLRDRATP